MPCSIVGTIVQSMIINVQLVYLYFWIKNHKPKIKFFWGIIFILFSSIGIGVRVSDIIMYTNSSDVMIRNVIDVWLLWLVLTSILFALYRIYLIDKLFSKVMRPKVDIVGFCLITAVSLALLLCFIFAVILLFLR